METIRDPSLILYVDLRKHDGNVFPSDDAYGYQWTVSGATWGVQGRRFDGVNNEITTPDNPNFSFGDSLNDTPFSVLGWAKIPSAGAAVCIISKYGEGWPTREWYLLSNGQQTLVSIADSSVSKGPYRITDVADTPINTWVLFGATYDGRGGASSCNGIVIYENGIAKASTANNEALYVAMENTAQNLAIGHQSGTFGVGISGEIWIYNYVLNPIEMQNLYMKTKWRYA